MPLNKVNQLTDMMPSEKLRINLISLFDWGFVDKGGFNNVNLDQSGCYVDNRSKLIKVEDRGQIYWQGVENWVFETGMEYGPCNSPATIYVDDVVDPTAEINYRDGRVSVSSVSSPTSVKAQYSYKWVNFTASRNQHNRRFVEYRKHLQEEDQRYTETTVPLPTVAFDVPSIKESRPWGLGYMAPSVHYHDITAYVFGESAEEVTRISDVIAKQKGFIFETFDPKLVSDSGDYPLNMDGTINSGKNHSELASLYPWSQIGFEEIEFNYGDYIHQHIYEGKIKIRTKIIVCF
jgi:hypothetical protein